MAPQKKITRSESMGKFFRDTEKGTCCGSRDPEAWGKILFFYLCFYGILTCFWAMCFHVMVDNLRPLEPENAPYINNLSPEADVETFATIKTGWGQAFPGTPKFIRSDSTTYAEHIQDINEILDRQGDKDSATLWLQSFCGTDYGYNANSTSFCVLSKLNRVFFHPQNDATNPKPRTINCTSANSTLTVEMSGHRTGQASSSTPTISEYVGEKFVNQANYTDPLVAIKVTPVALPIDKIKVTCKVENVQEGEFFFRASVDMPAN